MKNSSFNFRNKELGQVAVEYILITVVLGLITVFTWNQLRSQQVFSSLIQNPLSILNGMVTNGVWGDEKRTQGDHPNLKERHVSLDPE